MITESELVEVGSILNSKIVLVEICASKLSYAHYCRCPNPRDWCRIFIHAHTALYAKLSVSLLSVGWLVHYKERITQILSNILFLILPYNGVINVFFIKFQQDYTLTDYLKHKSSLQYTNSRELQRSSKLKVSLFLFIK